VFIGGVCHPLPYDIHMNNQEPMLNRFLYSVSLLIGMRRTEAARQEQERNLDFTCVL